LLLRVPAGQTGTARARTGAGVRAEWEWGADFEAGMRKPLHLLCQLQVQCASKCSRLLQQTVRYPPDPPPAHRRQSQGGNGRSHMRCSFESWRRCMWRCIWLWGICVFRGADGTATRLDCLSGCHQQGPTPSAPTCHAVQTTHQVEAQAVQTRFAAGKVPPGQSDAATVWGGGGGGEQVGDEGWLGVDGVGGAGPRLWKAVRQNTLTLAHTTVAGSTAPTLRPRSPQRRSAVLQNVEAQAVQTVALAQVVQPGGQALQVRLASSL
jgi:hypothetical protein